MYLQCIQQGVVSFVFSGSMGNWLRNQPTFLRDIIPMVLGALKEPSVAPIAALTFKDICDDCAEQLSCFSEQLMSACRVSVFDCGILVVLCHCTGGTS